MEDSEDEKQQELIDEYNRQIEEIPLEFPELYGMNEKEAKEMVENIEKEVNKVGIHAQSEKGTRIVTHLKNTHNLSYRKNCKSYLLLEADVCGYIYGKSDNLWTELIHRCVSDKIMQVVIRMSEGYSYYLFIFHCRFLSRLLIDLPVADYEYKELLRECKTIDERVSCFKRKYDELKTEKCYNKQEMICDIIEKCNLNKGYIKKIRSNGLTSLYSSFNKDSKENDSLYDYVKYLIPMVIPLFAIFSMMFIILNSSPLLIFLMIIKLFGVYIKFNLENIESNMMKKYKEWRYMRYKIPSNKEKFEYFIYKYII